MSENAERPARSGRGTGEKERPTASSVLIRPRNGRGGAADRIVRADPCCIRRLLFTKL